MADARTWYRLGLLGGFVLLLRELADAGQRYPRAVAAAGERMAGQIRGVMAYAQELDALDLSPEERQALMNAYMRGQREGAALPAADRG